MSYPKRDLLADISRFAGVTRIISALPRKPLLIVLNYHRIGDPAKSPFDAEVFSATASDLDDQISFWKRRFHITTLEEAIDMVDRPERHRGTAVLLTFDDGYLDNFDTAFPILAAHGVQGVFFLPTAFIGGNRIPWWDMIAFIIKNARKKSFRLPDSDRDFHVAPGAVNQTVAAVLELYRTRAQSGSEPFIVRLEEACGSSRPDGSQRCFLNWDEAAAMLRGGMAIGSHTHRHEILTRLPEEEQLLELKTSRDLLQERLGARIVSLSYPVGLRECFSLYTRKAAEEVGYRIAFSFYGGLNRIGSLNRYDVMRQSAAFGRSLGRYQLQGALAAVSGSYWY